MTDDHLILVQDNAQLVIQRLRNGAIGRPLAFVRAVDPLLKDMPQQEQQMALLQMVYRDKNGP